MQQFIDTYSSLAGHMQNEIPVLGAETNSSHQVESSLNLMHHAFRDSLVSALYARRMLMAGSQQRTGAVNRRSYSQRNICQVTEIGCWQWTLAKRSKNDGSIEAPLTDSRNHLLLTLTILRQFMPGIHPGSLIDNNIIKIGIEARNLRP